MDPERACDGERRHSGKRRVQPERDGHGGERCAGDHGAESAFCPEARALTIALSDLTVTDPDNVYPTEFTLSVQDGSNYSRVGNTITPALEFTGILTVPVTVSDGAMDSAVFFLAVRF